MKRHHERLITAGDAAKHAKVHPSTISAWIKAGLLPTAQIGKRKMVRLSHLQQIMRDRLTSPGKKLPRNTITDQPNPK